MKINPGLIYRIKVWCFLAGTLCAFVTFVIYLCHDYSAWNLFKGVLVLTLFMKFLSWGTGLGKHWEESLERVKACDKMKESGDTYSPYSYTDLDERDAIIEDVIYHLKIKKKIDSAVGTDFDWQTGTEYLVLPDGSRYLPPEDYDPHFLDGYDQDIYDE